MINGSEMKTKKEKNEKWKFVCKPNMAGDSGRDTLQKENNKQMKNKQKELNEHPGTGSNPPIGSDRKGVLHIGLICFFYSLENEIFYDY